MTPEEQNRAIAESIGWTQLHKIHSSGKWIGVDPSGRRSQVPNYTGSLDAMHCAEEYFNVPWSKWPSDKPYVGWDEYWKKPDRCPLCKGSKTVHVLGCGGDYEYQPCPKCQPQPTDYTYDSDDAN